MELTSLFHADVYSSLSRQLESLQTVLPVFTLFKSLAEQHAVTVVAGSFPVLQGDESYRNRSYLFRPDGTCDSQDKLQMTRFEIERWSIDAGDTIRGFPDDGVLASGKLNVPGWVFADIDLATLARVRAEGQVFNHRDWDAHLRFDCSEGSA